MSNYTKATNFATKDALSSGTAGKIVSGTEIDDELNAIQGSIATKVEANNGVHTGATTIADTTVTTATITTANVTNLTLVNPELAGDPITTFPSGTIMLFQQTTAPTGWTKITTHNNKALRVVSGTVTTGGTVAFDVAFANKGVSGTVGNTGLSAAQNGPHNHTVTADLEQAGGNLYGGGFFGRSTSLTTSTSGTGATHTHTFTGTAINMDVQHVDVIIASKD